MLKYDVIHYVLIPLPENQVTSNVNYPPKLTRNYSSKHTIYHNQSKNPLIISCN